MVTKRRNKFLTKSKINAEEKKAKRKLKTLEDLKKLSREGFKFGENPFSKRNISTSKSIMEKKLKLLINRNPRNKIIKKVVLKKAQHPYKDKEVYIFAIKK